MHTGRGWDFGLSRENAPSPDSPFRAGAMGAAFAAVPVLFR